MDYSKIYGFNVHGDWGSHGITEWLGFDAERYKKMIKIGKERFPAMNTVRVWLSFEAYMADKERYLKAVKSAMDILTANGLYIIPVYFNGWFGIPPFGGFVAENVREDQWHFYLDNLNDTLKVVKEANILLHDISNEPFNNSWQQGPKETVVKFLERMVQAVREVDERPITIGSQGYGACDIDVLAPLVDVFSLHPYNINGLSQSDFEKQFVQILEYLKPFNKPYLITECIWGAPDAESRRPYLESEFETYRKHNVGFLCHSLFTSPVADLYPLDNCSSTKGMLYMAFLDKDFNIRPNHELFNQYTKSDEKKENFTANKQIELT